MARSSIRLTPRRVPGQSRSRALVDAVLEATARLLATEGFEAAQMAEICRLAGVSIGSLYQYFPNKESLVAALYVRQREEMLSYVAENVLECSDGDAEDACRAIAHALVALHGEDRALWKVLFDAGPTIGVERKLVEVERQWREFLRTVILTRGCDARRADAEGSAALLADALDGIFRAAVATGEPLASAPLAERVGDLITGFVARR